MKSPAVNMPNLDSGRLLRPSSDPLQHALAQSVIPKADCANACGNSVRSVEAWVGSMWELCPICCGKDSLFPLCKKTVRCLQSEKILAGFWKNVDLQSCIPWPLPPLRTRYQPPLVWNRRTRDHHYHRSRPLPLQLSQRCQVTHGYTKSRLCQRMWELCPICWGLGRQHGLESYLCYNLNSKLNLIKGDILGLVSGN
jgi:hypothetical protein